MIIKTIAALLSLFLLGHSVIADSLTGKVIKITDGDTIHLFLKNRTKVKIRLAGIDCPERKQAFGGKAKKHLADLIATKTVTVNYSKRDRYGRIVGKILLNNHDVNLSMIKAGLAWHYKKYSKEQSHGDQKAYAIAENNARKQYLGLWHDKNAQPPWEWRKERRAKWKKK